MQSNFTIKDLFPNRSIKLSLLMLIIISLMLYIISTFHYLFFHMLIENFSIFVGLLIFVLATQTYKYSKNTLLLFLGYVYLFVAILDFLHLVTYYGMGIFAVKDANIATQFWVAERYFEVLSLAIAPFFIKRNNFKIPVITANILIVIFVILSIAWLKIFPLCYVDGVGLTSFKIFSEYMISLIIIIAILHFHNKRNQIDYSLYLTLITAMIITILTEIIFASYRNIYGIVNFSGHITRAMSDIVIYRGVVLHGLESPYNLIFKELKFSVIIEPLTGLYNRQGFIELADIEMIKARNARRSLGIILLDIDKFKKVNDQYGHIVGDNVLKRFARIIINSIQRNDIGCRLGGDEFVILCDEKRVDSIIQSLYKELSLWKNIDETVKEIGISSGAVIWKPSDPKTIINLIEEADQRMYQQKKNKNYSRT